ncbi:MAG TPA: aldose 1-epimerase family protein [Phnomibacter sp.]|nr:aldose 1-epimerase family protein [Phnomibacter sp.]
MIILRNAYLTASIHPVGAELQSLKHANGIEYMWQAGAAWPKHSPVLFPIVGTLKDNRYYHEGNEYSLPRHGFAREMEFETTQLSETEALFTLTANEETLKKYPFHFQFSLRYTLKDDTLSCAYEVTHNNTSAILFSVGGHPAFAVPLTANTSYEDHYLQFDVEEPLHRWKLQDGLLANNTVPISTQQGNIVPLQHELFYEDAIVLKHLQSSAVSIGSSKHTHGLSFQFAGFPHLGIWAAKDADFVCIEPWFGHADSIGHNQQLADKEGIISLPAGKEWSKAWSVRCY